MGNYSVDATVASGAASTTVLGLDGTTTTRGRLYDLILGSSATPADNAADFQIRRFSTNNGTGTAVTPIALDPADSAAEIDATQTYTVAPSLTANAEVLRWSQNQRATFRWVAAPGGEIVIPATSDSGVALIVDAIAGSAVAWQTCFHYSE